MALRRQRRWHRLLQVIILIGLIALILNGCGAPAPAPTPTVTATPAGSPTTICGAVVCSSQSDLAIDVGSAPKMQVRDTQEIRVLLYSRSSNSIQDDPVQTATVPAENATVTTTPVVPVGTPGTTLSNAFGPRYLPHATASLRANIDQFTITPISPPEQPLTQRSILWKWLVTANKTGTSILDVNISVIWQPQAANLPKQGPWSIGDQQISIQVTEPIPTPTPTFAPTPTTVPAPTSIQTPIPAPFHEGSGVNTQFMIGLLAVITGFLGVITAAITLINVYMKQREKKKTEEEKTKSDHSGITTVSDGQLKESQEK